LKNHGPLLAWPGDAHAVQRHFPSIWPQQLQTYIKKGALDATQGAHDADEFSSYNFEAEGPKRGYGLSVFGFEDQSDVCGLYKRCRRRPAILCSSNCGLLYSQFLIHFPL
jgi:hypothetical protein